MTDKKLDVTTSDTEVEVKAAPGGTTAPSSSDDQKKKDPFHRPL